MSSGGISDLSTLGAGSSEDVSDVLAPLMPIRAIMAAMRARWLIDDRETALMERENRVARREQELDELQRINRELRRRLSRAVEIMEKE